MAVRDLDSILNSKSGLAVIPELVSSFLPISCHYDKSILITKTGDLTITISVNGYSTDTNDIESVRSKVRRSLVKNIDSYKVAVYLHTIRNWQNIIPKGVIPFGFAASLNNAWCKHNNWDRQLVNTLYITLVYQGLKISSLDPRCLFPYKVRSLYEANWEMAASKLHSVADQICQELKTIGARKLTITESKSGLVSEPLSFYYYLTHFKEAPAFLPAKDLAISMADYKLDYKFNHIHFKYPDSEAYATVFTLKESIDSPESLYSTIMQANFRFIASEVLIFTDKVAALQEYKKSAKTIEISRDNELINQIGLQSIFDADQGNISDYCLYQNNILIHSETKDNLNASIHAACRVFSESGFMTSREDFNMARCYWAMMPGNFKYLCRTKYGATSLLCNLSCLHDANSGNSAGSRWGPPISLLKTVKDAVFYFNFHEHENGNTILIGPKGSGKTTLIKFLLAQSVKIDPKIIYIDLNGNDEKFIKKMGGNYIHIGNEDSPIKIFPFDPTLFFGQNNLIYSWLMEACNLDTENKRNEAQTFVNTLLDNLLLLPTVEERQLALNGILEDLNSKPHLNPFINLLNKETYNTLFNQNSYNVLRSSNTLGINFANIKSHALRTAFLALLLSVISKNLSGEPTIIMINESVSLFEECSFNKLMQPWLQSLSLKNAIAIMELESTKKVQNNPLLNNTLEQFATKIFMTDNLSDKSFKFAFNLHETEHIRIKTYTPDRRVFLIKQSNISVLTSLYMEGLEQIIEN